jgi:diphthine-ammonia ligase
MIEHRIEAQIVKVCSMGLKSLHLGKTIGQLRDHFAKLASQFDFNVCGEGGEYESAVFDCPIFSKRIVCSNTEIVMHEDNPVCEVAYLQYKELALEEKSPEELKNDKELMDQLR